MNRCTMPKHPVMSVNADRRNTMGTVFQLSVEKYCRKEYDIARKDDVLIKKLLTRETGRR